MKSSVYIVGMPAILGITDYFERITMYKEYMEVFNSVREMGYDITSTYYSEDVILKGVFASPLHELKVSQQNLSNALMETVAVILPDGFEKNHLVKLELDLLKASNWTVIPLGALLSKGFDMELDGKKVTGVLEPTLIYTLKVSEKEGRNVLTSLELEDFGDYTKLNATMSRYKQHYREEDGYYLIRILRNISPNISAITMALKPESIQVEKEVMTQIIEMYLDSSPITQDWAELVQEVLYNR